MATIYWIANGFFTLWFGSGMLIYFSKKSGIDLSSKKIYRFMRWCYHEIKPFTISLIAVMCIFCPWTPPSNVIDTALNLFVWWTYKDVDKDDRWKKRLKEAKSKVEVKSSRLIVVPEAT